MKFQYLLDRYAQSLTKYDIKVLVDRLIKIKGNITAATKAANIKRKTYYDWEHNSEGVRPETKRKVLLTCLENDLFGTIEFLIKKDELDYRELLQRYIHMTQDEISKATNPSEVEKWSMLLEKFIKSRVGAIQDSKIISIDELLDSVNAKSKALGIKEIKIDLRLIPSNLLSEKFINLLDIFCNKRSIPCNEIATLLGLPEEFVNKACQVYAYTPDAYSTEATRNSYMGRRQDRMSDNQDKVMHPEKLENPGLYFAIRNK